MDAPSLYERVLSAAGGRPSAPAAKVRASAAVVLWRRAPEGGLEVFWMRRKPTLRFMGGWHAFPGGAVARADRAGGEEAAEWLRGAPPGLDPERVGGALPASLTEGLEMEADGAPGVVVAALRELFEETGLLPTAEGLAGRDDPSERARRRLLDGVPFPELVRELGLTLDASRLVYAGRWLTPPLAPLRFDNRYFLLEHSPGSPEPAVPDEAAEAGWVAPKEAVELWRRGDSIAAPPILYLLRALAAQPAGTDPSAAPALLARLREPADADLGPYRRIDFRPGIVMLPLPTPTLPPATHTNAYLVGPPGGGEAVLVDPGTPYRTEIDRLEAAVRAAGEEPAGAGDGGSFQGPLVVREILLTHHHGDHVGAVSALAERLGLPVAAHPATADRLAARGIRVDRTIEDGDRLELASRTGGEPLVLTALHTPGHAPGHLCFHEERGGSLLAGDMLSAVSTIVVDPPEGDMDRYLESLERLAALAPRTIFPGHGPAILDGAAKLRELIDHRLWREEKVLAAWRAGARGAREMLPSVYDDAPREAWPLAERQIEAHLQRLARVGAIDRRRSRTPGGP